MENNITYRDQKERSKDQEFFDKINGKAFTAQNKTYLVRGYEIGSKRFIVDVCDLRKEETSKECTMTLDHIKNLIIESFLEREEYEDCSAIYPEVWDKLKKAFGRLCTFRGSTDELSLDFNYIYRNSLGWENIIRYIKNNPKGNIRELFEVYSEETGNSEQGEIIGNNIIKEKFCRKMFDKQFMFENRRYTVLNYDFDRDLFVISKEIFGPKPGTADIIYTTIERGELEKMVEGVRLLEASR